MKIDWLRVIIVTSFICLVIAYFKYIPELSKYYKFIPSEGQTHVKEVVIYPLH